MILYEIYIYIYIYIYTQSQIGNYSTKILVNICGFQLTKWYEETKIQIVTEEKLAYRSSRRGKNLPDEVKKKCVEQGSWTIMYRKPMSKAKSSFY